MRRHAGVLAGMLLALGAPAAQSAETVIDFESPGPGTTITDQYADVGGTDQGVVFGPLPGGAGDGHQPIIVAPGAGQTSSGVQAADISWSPGCEGCQPRTTGTFAIPRSRVSVHVGFPGEAGPACTPATATENHCVEATLIAYDAAGTQVAASEPRLLTRGAGAGTVLTVQTDSARIVGFLVRSRDDDYFRSIAIDDLALEIPETPPPPDFALIPERAELVVRQGQTIDGPIVVRRLSGSTGDVRFEVAGALPEGVRAEIAPNPATGNATALRVTAEPGAVPTTQPVMLTVTGTPSSSSAGTETRTAQIAVRVHQAFDIRATGPTDVDVAACTVRIPFAVSRDFSLDGPVSLSVSGVPPGVTAVMVPAQATFAGGQGSETVHLEVTAPATGTPIDAATLTVHATAPPLVERTASVRIHGACPAQYDPRVSSIQITQGTQSRFLPARDGVHSAVVRYADIPSAALLRRDGPTVVRAYANLRTGPAEGVARVPMVLAGYTWDRNGTTKPLPGSPLLPHEGPRALRLGAIDPTVPEMESDTSAYTFTLPPEWTRGTIGVSAQLQPALPPPQPVLATERQAGPRERTVAPCLTAECKIDDHFAITRIPFHAAPGLTVRPLDMRVNGTPSPPPETVFQMTRVTTPLHVQVLPYQAVIDISDIASGTGNADQRNSAVVGRVHDWVCDNGNFAMGVNPGAVARGLYRSGAWCWSQLDTINSAVVAHESTLVSVAHEWYHWLGRLHASPGCGGGANGERAEPWPPDQEGFLQSVGLDTRLGSGPGNAPYDVKPGSPAVWFDLMSYCASRTGNAWISVRNWNAVMNDRAYLSRAAPRAQAGGPTVPSLVVEAFATAAGEAQIVSVERRDVPAQPPSPSAYRLVASDASGQVLADVPMLESTDHVDGQAPPTALTAAVPAEGVAAVAVVRDGVTLAERRASAALPSVSRPTIAAGRRTATIRWRARDADGDALAVSVEYSADAGRTYRLIFSGPDRGVARLPARLLPRAARARVRLSVTDGFHSRDALSRVFRSAGAPPTVRITSPVGGLRQPNDATVLLAGEAFDDAGRPVADRRLTWTLGRRVLGRGEQLAVSGLPAGGRVVTLTARDRAGRRARARVRLRLAAAQPLFLRLVAPKTVAPRARSAALRVASSLDARLLVRGRGVPPQRFRVGRAERRVRVGIPASRRKLTLRLILRAGGRSRAAALTIRRR